LEIVVVKDAESLNLLKNILTKQISICVSY